MTKIKIGDLEEGMKLDADVKGPHGKVLLSKGTIISNQHIKILKTWGVHEVSIPGDASEVDEDYTNEELEAAASAISQKFIHNNLEHVFFKFFFKEACKLKAKEMREGNVDASQS